MTPACILTRCADGYIEPVPQLRFRNPGRANAPLDDKLSDREKRKLAKLERQTNPTLSPSPTIINVCYLGLMHVM